MANASSTTELSANYRTGCRLRVVAGILENQRKDLDEMIEQNETLRGVIAKMLFEFNEPAPDEVQEMFRAMLKVAK